MIYNGVWPLAHSYFREDTRGFSPDQSKAEQFTHNNPMSGTARRHSSVVSGLMGDIRVNRRLPGMNPFPLVDESSIQQVSNVMQIKQIPFSFVDLRKFSSGITNWSSASGSSLFIVNMPCPTSIAFYYCRKMKYANNFMQGK